MMVAAGPLIFMKQASAWRLGVFVFFAFLFFFSFFTSCSFPNSVIQTRFRRLYPCHEKHLRQYENTLYRGERDYCDGPRSWSRRIQFTKPRRLGSSMSQVAPNPIGFKVLKMIHLPWWPWLW
ncbi:hypothetical protein QBC32DRAFT_21954 [Pseudoneurospora amorphoporcata]|uniref:Uncharacterized protein n=1 Tax=Pseudoneurospora amorphoporcata TaxID=241081 RepID=A0AAN6SE00_9PEZI|nr:hypothetical protein QBC32DRAFT_21954 [Pseudoneurospora amorphoporcata]